MNNDEPGSSSVSNDPRAGQSGAVVDGTAEFRRETADANDDVVVIVPAADVGGEVDAVAPVAAENDVVAFNVVLHDVITAAMNTPTPPKRRRSKTSKSPSPRKKVHAELPHHADDDDDGSTCPICLDSWEMCGPHRLTSLKCGHLFGHSCIKRWINECAAPNRCCPSCKKKAFQRDFRFLYAKKIAAIDNTELNAMKTQLETERTKTTQLEMTLSVTKVKLSIAEQSNDELMEQLKRLQSAAKCADLDGPFDQSAANRSYKLFLEKNIDMGRDADCRVLIYHARRSSMIVSQKSTQSLFPGYGVRMIDVSTYRPNVFLHVSNNWLRDITIDSEDAMMVSASRERNSKLYNINDRNVVTTLAAPNDQVIWSCCFDHDRSKFIYLGIGGGLTVVYDIRRPTEIVQEFHSGFDRTQVINICSVPGHEAIPFGGFVVCQLKSIWFYEYTATQEVVKFQLNIDGSFISASYEVKSKTLLVVTRPSALHPNVRYILGTLVKHDNFVTLKIQSIILGSVGMQIMIRSALANLDPNTLYLTSYLEDSKHLAVWNASNAQKIQSISVNKTVLDLVPFTTSNGSKCLGGVTETDFKIYKFNEQST